MGTNPKDNFLSQEGMNPKELDKFPKSFIVVVLYSSIQYVLYQLGTFFEEDCTVYSLLGTFF